MHFEIQNKKKEICISHLGLELALVFTMIFWPCMKINLVAVVHAMRKEKRKRKNVNILRQIKEFQVKCKVKKTHTEDDQ